jgi:hypothetical protein
VAISTETVTGRGVGNYSLNDNSQSRITSTSVTDEQASVSETAANDPKGVKIQETYDRIIDVALKN